MALCIVLEMCSGVRLSTVRVRPHAPIGVRRSFFHPVPRVRGGSFGGTSRLLEVGLSRSEVQIVGLLRCMLVP